MDVPVRQRMLVVIGHQANREPLVMAMGFGKRAVDDVPAILTGLRLELGPETAKICHAGAGKVDGADRSVRKRFLGPDLGPLHSFIQRLPGKTVEGLDAHPRIHQDVVDFGWSNDDGRFGLCGCQGAKQNNDESEGALDHKQSIFSCTKGSGEYLRFSQRQNYSWLLLDRHQVGDLVILSFGNDSARQQVTCFVVWAGSNHSVGPHRSYAWKGEQLLFGGGV